MMATTENQSGRLWLDESGLHYSLSPGDSWTIPLGQLLIFGEYTTDHGPFLDDYYFVFITGPETAYCASFYSDGREEFLGDLRTKLGAPFQCKLIGSTQFDSNVLWPEDLAGKPLYRFEGKPAQGIGMRVMRVLGFGKINVSLSPQVLAKLEQGSVEPSS